MAVFPRKRKNGLHARSDLARLPVLAAAFLIAFFGLVTGAPRNADIAASARAVDDRSDRTPSLSKRDPIRAVSIADRKDGASSHFSGDDGLPASAFFALPEVLYTAARAPADGRSPVERDMWPGALPRAPPVPG